MERNYGQPLEPLLSSRTCRLPRNLKASFSQYTAKGYGPQLYSHKETNSAKNMNNLGSRFSRIEQQDENPNGQML